MSRASKPAISSSDEPSFDELYRKVKELAAQDSSPAIFDFYQAVRTYGAIIRENPNWDNRRVDLHFLRSELERLRIHCRDKGFSDHIDAGDVLEVYAADHLQVFRNFQYFLYSSYSLRELVSNPWTELFERDEVYLRGLQEDLGRLMQSDGKMPLVPQTPPHILKEKGARQYQFQIHYKFLWPLFNQAQQFAGYLVTQSVKKMN